MDDNIEQYQISENTNIEVQEGSITAEEKNWLKRNGVLRIEAYKTDTGEVANAVLDIQKLSEMAFEYDILRKVASPVEIDILSTFRDSTNDTLTTEEITEYTDRPKSSVSRALSRLSEKGKITKVQAGVYRY